MKFPFLFIPSRYVGLDPTDQQGADQRGLEFVRFHDRTILKVSGNYNAAFNANLLTQNQRRGSPKYHPRRNLARFILTLA